MLSSPCHQQQAAVTVSPRLNFEKCSQNVNSCLRRALNVNTGIWEKQKGAQRNSRLRRKTEERHRKGVPGPALTDPATALARNRPFLGGGAFSAQGPQPGAELPEFHNHGGMRGLQGWGMGEVQSQTRSCSSATTVLPFHHSPSRKSSYSPNFVLKRSIKLSKETILEGNKASIIKIKPPNSVNET